MASLKCKQTITTFFFTFHYSVFFVVSNDLVKKNHFVPFKIMFSHNYAVFANNCVKTPLHSSTKLPNPSYLKPKCKTSSAKSSNLKKCSKQFSSSLSLTTENNNFLSLKDFYDSIPDYDDLHHLSQYDFYKEIDALKRKQQELKETCLFTDELCSRVWSKVATPELQNFSGVGCVGSDFGELAHRSNSSRHFDEFNKYMDYFGTDPKVTSKSRRSSAKSVRIGENTDRPPYITPHDDNPTRIFKKSLRSKSVSPIRDSVPSLTVPQPFRMSQRDEDQRTLDDLMQTSKTFLGSPIKSSDIKSPKSKVHPIPITSKIPLFKQIMEDKEHKSALARLDSAMELNAQVKPFGFDNGPDRPRSRCISRSLSSPQINSPEPPPRSRSPSPETAPPPKFKANPSPKKVLDSNYFHQKMEEEDYFRNLNKRVRAEELLKMSTLPPSMKRREKGVKKIEQHSCVYTPSSSATSRKSKKKKRPKKRPSSAKTTPTASKDEFITTCKHPFDFVTEKRSKERPDRAARKMAPTPTTPTTITNSSSSFKNLAPRPLYPVNRPNLAATLRFEHSRRRLKELSELSESIIQGTVKPFRWNVKKTPGWQALSYE